MTEAPHTHRTPAHGRRARADDRPARPRRRRRGARLDGYVVFVRGAVPGRPRAGAGDQVQALVRRGGLGRAARALARTAIEPRGAAPGRALAGAALRAPAAARRRTRCATRSRASAASRTRRSSRSCPRVEQLRYRNKLEYSFGEDERGRAGARLPPPGPLRPDRRREPRHPRLRARRRAARGGQGLVPRGGPVGLGPAQPARGCCATSSCARAAAPASSRRAS